MRRLFVILLLLAGCAAATDRPGTDDVLAMAKAQDFSAQTVAGGTFLIPAWIKGRARNAKHVYIEGDGRAWISPSLPSNDPTPRDPVALRLALLDPSPDIIYLGRPCQYGTVTVDPACHPRYWTEERFAPDVIEAYENAMDELGISGEADLIGYSGGAAIALLLAARHPEHWSVITVAGILDHAAWTHYHGDTKLSGSLNPADFLESLRQVPQVHVTGGKDEIAPPALAAAYVDTVKSPCVRSLVIPEATHHAGWFLHWPGISRIDPRSC